MLKEGEAGILAALSGPDVSPEALALAEQVARLARENRELKAENSWIRGRIAEEEARVGA